MARDGDRFLRDAFHQVAVRGEHIGEMINRIAEFRVHHALGERHANRCRNALPERTRGGLDAARDEVFRVARGLRAKLAEVLDLVDRHAGRAGEIEQRIEQHGAMARRQHEAVAVGPGRVGGVIFQHVAEEHGGDIGSAHGQARMAGFGLFDRIHRKGSDRIGHRLVGDAHGALFQWRRPGRGGWARRREALAQPRAQRHGPVKIERRGFDNRSPLPVNADRGARPERRAKFLPCCTGIPVRWLQNELWDGAASALTRMTFLPLMSVNSGFCTS